MDAETDISSTSFVSQLESWADDQFARTELPHPIKDVSTWHLLTVAEDWIRLLFTGDIEVPAHEISATVDRLKYALKHCLARVHDSSIIHDAFPTPKKTIPTAYTKAHNLIISGIEYANMVRIFTTVHCGHSSIEIFGNKYEIRFRNSYDFRYAALEILSHGKTLEFDISTLLYNILNEKEEDPELSEALTNGLFIKNRRVHYAYNPRGVLVILERAPQRDIIIPDSFIFDWGNGFETQALINSFQLRCIYHLLSVNYAVKKFDFPGGFESSLVLQTTKHQLIKDLEYLADFGESKLSCFIDFLTYGYECLTPDPALQPIIRAENGDLLIPCAHVITSNMQRNILTLLARIRSSNFHCQSELFEVAMCEELRKASDCWSIKESNKTYRAGTHKEEIDFLILDEVNKSVLLMELRWMLQPGDPREILNRVGVCDGKVEQLMKKVEFFRENIEELLAKYFSICSSKSTWNVCGIVVLKGFGGHISSHREFPVVTSEVLKIGLAAIPHLKALHGWAKSLEWLPQPDNHFTNEMSEINIGPVVLGEHSFSLNGDSTAYSKHIKETALAASISRS